MLTKVTSWPRRCAVPGFRPAVLALAVLWFAAPAAAQPAAVDVMVGLAGSNITDQPNVEGLTTQRELGFLVGLSVDAPGDSTGSLQIEALYARKGSRVEAPVPGGVGTASIVEQFDYIEVPLLVRIGAGSAHAGPYALVGPAIAWVVRARERFEMPGTPALDQDTKDSVTGVDASIIFGGGWSTGRFGIEGRADLGLRNLIPSDLRRSGDPEPKNRSLAVVLRVRL